MPLESGKSKAAFGHNIKAEVDAGKPLKQSLAIAYSQKRRSGKKMAEGGEVKEKPLYDTSGYGSKPQPQPTPNPQSARIFAHGGMVGSPQSIVQAMKEKQLPSEPLSEAEPDFLSNEGEDLDYGLELPEEDESERNHKLISNILMRIGQK